MDFDSLIQNIFFYFFFNITSSMCFDT
uniref:Uncharacterized protein n=1 Tax=Rhizophora mucronata TaxID=61149 RepID=A0A2P2Q8E0_RHIMU